MAKKKQVEVYTKVGDTFFYDNSQFIAVKLDSNGCNACYFSNQSCEVLLKNGSIPDCCGVTFKKIESAVSANFTIYPTEDVINSLVEKFDANSETKKSKDMTKLCYKEGLRKMLEIWKESNNN